MAKLAPAGGSSHQCQERSGKDNAPPLHGLPKSAAPAPALMPKMYLGFLARPYLAVKASTTCLEEGWSSAGEGGGSKGQIQATPSRRPIWIEALGCKT